MDVRLDRYLAMVDTAYGLELEVSVIEGSHGPQGAAARFLRASKQEAANRERNSANLLLAEILGARAAPTGYAWAIGQFLGYPRHSLDYSYECDFTVPAIHLGGTGSQNECTVNPFDHRRKMNKDRKPFSILSAPYCIPVDLDGAFPAVVGLPLRRSWYGHGTVGLLWVKRESEAWVRDVLGDLVVDPATAMASMIEAHAQAGAAYAKRKAA